MCMLYARRASEKMEAYIGGEMMRAMSLPQLTSSREKLGRNCRTDGADFRIWRVGDTILTCQSLLVDKRS